METASISKYKCPECDDKLLLKTFENGINQALCITCDFVLNEWNASKLEDYLKDNQRRKS